MRSPTKIPSELGTTVRFDPGNDAAIGRLRQKYKASRCAEYLKKVIDSLNARPATRASVTENNSMGPNTAGDEYRGHGGRTQWDAMTEAISGERFRASKLALLIFVRYGICTTAGLALAYKLIEVIGQHR